MIQIKTILAPTDFSAHSETALRYACMLAERLDAKLHLLHVLVEITPTGPDPLLAPSLPPEYYLDAEAASLDALKKLPEPAWGKVEVADYAIKWGEPVTEIVGYARDNHIDMIVIATHGWTGLRHVLLGSVAEQIVREATCPVLTIHDRTAGPASHT